MIKRIPFIVLVFAGILVTGCKKSPVLDLEYVPVMSSCVVEKISFNSVSFSTTFEHLDPAFVEDCGFFWGEKQENNLKEIHIGTIQERKFSCSENAKPDPGKEYVVKAWVRSGSKYFYSAPTYFFGEATIKPEIVSLNRTYALWGDTVKIKVKNLEPKVNYQDIRVIIEYSSIEPIYADVNEIHVIMPFSKTQGKLSLRVLMNNHPFANNAEIENGIPLITSLRQGWIHYGDTISVIGKFRPEYSDRIVPIISYNVPYTLISFGEYELKLKLPDEVSCSASHSIGFRILSANGNGMTEHLSTDFGVSMMGHWYELNTAAPAISSKAVMINDVAYILEMTLAVPNSKFWKYNILTDLWEKLTDYPAYAAINQSLVVCVGEIFAGFSVVTGQNTNFFKYDAQNNIWISRAKLPIPNNTGHITTVVISQRVYAFLNGSNQKGVYDPTTDSWTMTNCFVPNFDANTSVFYYLGDYYFFKGTNSNDLYKYEMATDTFIPVNIPGLKNTSSCFFKLGNKFYCTDKCKAYELDMEEKKLVWHPELSNYMAAYDFYNEDYAHMFSFNNKAYFIFDPHILLTLGTENK